MLSLKLPFKKQQFEAREEAILDAVNQLLSEKGFDLMTMDDVADAVGVAKGSLYKHFSSKEKLAAAVMTRLLRQTVEVLDRMPVEWRAVRRRGRRRRVGSADAASEPVSATSSSMEL